ncbi:phospholipase [Hyphomicrobium methylovorum]|uniref:alpha/beta hydrolase n=1 Tax=Hyphomicrobium methylovorum TaxID=84 RepID=UPI0015E7BAE2|nr:dienelactone hydrolase family protein [Hyphomicrobium methylovorum]MBA2125911.1 phospholipase [Hyphomicrobium methylovorum]
MTREPSQLSRAGAPIGAARAAVIMIHGRGASAGGMLGLADAFGTTDVAYLAPQAPHGSWYPYSFLAPLEDNEPDLGQALNTISSAVAGVIRDGIPSDRIVLLGFSQGACLALEYAARNAQRYGGVVGLSGGLIGPDGTPRTYPGSLENTPVFLGCSDIDAHIPLARVEESASIMASLGGAVTKRIYPGMGHTIAQDEINHVQKILFGIGAEQTL